MVSNDFNEITISDLSGAFTNSIVPYSHLDYNLFTDDKNVITKNMDQNDKIKMVFIDSTIVKIYISICKTRT